MGPKAQERIEISLSEHLGRIPKRTETAFGDPSAGFAGTTGAGTPRREVVSLFHFLVIWREREQTMTRLCCTNNTGPDSALLVADEPADIRVDKVLDIRRQLGEGTYSIEDRLDVVIERIIADLS